LQPMRIKLMLSLLRDRDINSMKCIISIIENASISHTYARTAIYPLKSFYNSFNIIKINNVNKH